MSAFTAINLSTLPAPQIVETPKFEVIVADMKARLIAEMPEMEAVLALESEPLVKAIEVFAYRETVLRARINDAAKAVMLAFAKGSNLDNLAALYGVEREVVQAADATAIPPLALVMESDERLQTRAQLAFEGLASAGPIDAYISHGLNADVDVKDISISSPVPGDVQVTVLSATGDGLADAALIAKVSAALNDEFVRPLNDKVEVVAANIQNWALDATLTLYDGPDGSLVLEAAIKAATQYVIDHHALGHDITISGLHAALHQGGVQKVVLNTPSNDIVVAPDSAAYCQSIDVVIGGRDA